MYRFGNGAFVALFPAPIITFGEIKDVGRRVGAGMTILSIAALAGPPISGAIYEKTGGFEAVGYYAGEPNQYYGSYFVEMHSCHRINNISVCSAYALQ